MSNDLRNPFDLVKATDLTDDQIAAYFVDISEGSLIERVKPRSPMPMIIYGGKGSGKTHLMRYLSFALQSQRYSSKRSLQDGVSSDGYLGIYFRCGGLNAHRFGGKGQSEDAWRDVFAYYMELWIGQLLLNTILPLTTSIEPSEASRIASAASKLLDIGPAQTPRSLQELLAHLSELQRTADVAINNCAITRKLELQIVATPGRLVFGLPRLLGDAIPCLKTALFLYLVDELENLTEDQQRYMNTLVREREDPVTFKIGVRLYGFRTRATLSAEEENREDSEFEVLRLDEELRERRDDAQRRFAAELVNKRLRNTGYLKSEDSVDPSKYFEEEDEVSLEKTENPSLQLAPALTALRQKLEAGLKHEIAPGIRSRADIDEVLKRLSAAESTLLGRTSIFLFYRAWFDKENLLAAAKHIAEDARKKESPEHKKALRYFRSDISAQLLRETRQRQRYAGFETFVRMSAGLPRGLLTILKHVFLWSKFYGEKPFAEGKISLQAQSDGVAQASEWFFSEARAPGPDGKLIRDAMTRLGQLLRDIRFSDKPSESSISSFSANVTTASEEANRILESARNWSMLVRIPGGQHDRNDGRADEKYQVHPMLAPRWDLPIFRRGAIALSGPEVDAIFSPVSLENFQLVLKRRVGGMTAPSFGANLRDTTDGLFS